MNARSDIVIRFFAVCLMVAGAVLLVGGDASAIPFAVITIGIALTVIVQYAEGPHHRAR